MSAFPTGIVYLGELTAVGAVNDTDTTFWCDVATGGTVGVPLKRVTAAQLRAFFGTGGGGGGGGGGGSIWDGGATVWD